MKRRWIILSMAAAAGELPAQGSISGTVLVDSAGTPIAKAVVTIYNSMKQVTTDSLGRFRITDLPIGFHEVTVKRIGFVPYVERVPVRRNAPTDVEIPLVPVPRRDSAAAANGSAIASFDENKS